eukprot:TRINITY_DN1226_c0_g1_i1.p1 TRINITY_DN1226_c0_g1~~TRINITY_DN1226_c0_g1_i1.p1  ORF type:complete len:290 (-),score=65.84 TRINITY_DN1226_c0_g1_i1:234-1103(-)
MKLSESFIFCFAALFAIVSGEEEDLRTEFKEEDLRALHKDIDSDGDGKASLDEFRQFAVQQFMSNSRREFDQQQKGNESYEEKSLGMHIIDFKDLLKDQNTSAEEIRKYVEFIRAKLRAADANGNKWIETEEYYHYRYHTTDAVLTVVANNKFKESDKNSDGFLDYEEFDELNVKDMSIWLEMEDAQQRAEIKKSKLRVRDCQKSFALLDGNGDGKLDDSEFKPYSSQHHSHEVQSAILLDRADTNHDAHLDADELVKSGLLRGREDWDNIREVVEQWLDSEESSKQEL